MKLKKIIFKNCSLKEVDFSETDLSCALFDDCNLDKAVFDNTNLEVADFRTSINYAIAPKKNNIIKAKFSHAGWHGLLYKYKIEIS